MDKIVVTTGEVNRVTEQPDLVAAPQAALASPIPVAARILLAALVVVLPVLCLVALGLRILVRGEDRRTRSAWSDYLNSLLIASGLIASAAFTVVLSIGPVTPLGPRGLTALDDRTSFPQLPSVNSMTGAQLAATMKPLVAVVQPHQRLWGNWGTNSMGAAVLLYADAAGYLFATARHVIESGGRAASVSTITMYDGDSGEAHLIGVHQSLDLALLWAPRRKGTASFAQPVVAEPEVGESVFLIGHPQGLLFSMSSGIVARIDSNAGLQLSAAISPGNSGGPAYDDNGRLVGIVVSKLDRTIVPNAENVGFAVPASALISEREWSFEPEGHSTFCHFARCNPQTNRK